MMEKRTLVAFICTLLILGGGVVVGVYFGLTIGRQTDEENIQVQPILDSKGGALSFFSQTDGLDIRWFSQANTPSRLDDALSGDYMMVASDVNLGGEALTNSSAIIPVMGDAESSTFPLENWLQQVKMREKIGVKLSFHSIDAVEPTLTVLKRADLSDRPVWLEANIVDAAGDGQILDSVRFFDIVQNIYPSAIVSLGWTTKCCNGRYTREMVEQMYKLVQRANFYLTFMIRASWLKESLDSIRWLLLKSDRFSLTVWSPPESANWEGVSAYDLVNLRNDYYVDRIYYQLEGKMLESFTRLATTAGNPMNVFKLRRRDALDITFAHAVNSMDRHKQVLQGPEDFLEADILLSAEGVPIMAHPPDLTSDLTFSDFIDGTLLTLKGMKLDFKSIDAVNPALRYLQSKSTVLHQPVWLNADVLPGPGGNATPVDGQDFLRYVRNRFPQATLSLGWTTGRTTALQYTAQHIDDMLTLIGSIVQPITFPVRADLVRASWSELSRLLSKSRSYSLSLWSRDEVNVDDLLWIRANSDRDRVYYDLPARTMEEFRSKI